MGMKQQAGIRMKDQEIVHLGEPAEGGVFTKSEVVLDADDEG